MAHLGNEMDYMYQSARIRALENRLIGAEGFRRLLSAKSASEVMDGLSAYGYDTALPTEEMLVARLSQCYAELCGMDCGEVVAPLRLPYDAAGLKTVIKCAPDGRSAQGLSVDGLAAISYGAAADAYERGDYSLYPPHLAEAAPVARGRFAESGNPQSVDILLDRACYADMADKAAESGVSLLVRLCQMKADLCNLQMAVRLGRMNLPKLAGPLYEQMKVPGGALEADFFALCLTEDGEEALAQRLAFTPYSALCGYLERHAPLWALEKAADDVRMEVARTASYAPFGAQVAVGYAMAMEYETVNLRILLAMKEAGASAEEVSERLRMSYV